MRRINPKHYESFTIIADGFTITLNTFQNARRMWSTFNNPKSQLVGNKYDGTKVIIDKK